MNKIFFVADQFFTDGFNGGAEKCDDVIVQELLNVKYNDYDDYMMLQINTKDLSPEIIAKNASELFFISNFMLLSEDSKTALMYENCKYVIIEHDHKYLKSNNPALYKNFLANEENLQNALFYQRAKYVMTQSTLAAEILYKNLPFTNIVNLQGNLWIEEELQLLRKLAMDSEKTTKTIEYGILNSTNKNKGTPSTIRYCNDRKLNYTFLGGPYESFINQLLKTKTFLFFPTWVETFNRLCVEARCVGCKIRTNKKLGAAVDGYLSLQGTQLVDKLEETKTRILNIYDDVVQGREVTTYKKEMPRVTIMTTFIDAQPFIESFLQSIKNQTIFSEIDLIIYDAGSTGTEQGIIDKFCQENSNVTYIREESRRGSSECFNLMTDQSKNEFVSMVMIDDQLVPTYAEKLRKYLMFSGADLVYGDAAQSYSPNFPLQEISTCDEYEHSLMDFTPENMIKCLPGPFPMFKKSIITKNGGFNTNFKHANDWELWLRCVRGGSRFFKVHDKVGLYYFNPDGVTTSADTFQNKLIEESSLFHEYKDVLGQENYDKYKQYFSHGANNE